MNFFVSFSNNIIKTRYIVSNHMIYNTPEKLTTIMKNISISPSDFDISCETWYKTNNWWDDLEFMDAMNICGIDITKAIYKK